MPPLPGIDLRHTMDISGINSRCGYPPLLRPAPRRPAQSQMGPRLYGGTTRSGGTRRVDGTPLMTIKWLHLNRTLSYHSPQGQLRPSSPQSSNTQPELGICYRSTGRVRRDPTQYFFHSSGHHFPSPLATCAFSPLPDRGARPRPSPSNAPASAGVTPKPHDSAPDELRAGQASLNAQLLPLPSFYQRRRTHRNNACWRRWCTDAG